MKKFKLSAFLLLTIILLAPAGRQFAQTTDWSNYKIVAPQKFRFDPSLADNFYHNPEPNVLVVQTVGAFDNYKVSASGFCETDCAVNPRNPLNFIFCDNNVQQSSGNYWTTDGGQSSWSLGTGLAGNQGDGVVAFDSVGNAYLAILNQGVRVFRSTNNGANWSNQYTIVSNNANADKEWIACDQTSGPFKNNVYMAYVNFSAGTSVDFWRSTDNGVTWSGPQTLGNGTPNPGPDVETGPNGEVYVMWYGGNGTYTMKSTNGGASFGPLVIASNHSQPGSIQFGRNCLKNAIRVNGMPHFAVDMSNGSHRGYIYVTYCTNPAGPDAADIFMTRSTDGGATYSTGSPLRVNDDATTYDQFMNDVSVDAQGRVWVMWYDSRNDTANVNIELYAAVSTNGGVSFLPNIKVSNAPFNANIASISQGSGAARYIGDYQGIAGKNFTLPVWMDNRFNGHPDYTAYLPDYGMLLDKNNDTITPGNSISHKMLMPLMGPYSGTVTLTSSVTPSPAPGSITVTFVPGNVRNFTGNADSVTVNITTSANVPDNYYYLSIIGTETGGPRTHTRPDTLLITHSIGIHGNSSEVPKSFALYQNYPNPFNPSTKIEYALPKNAFVTLKVYDVLGREVADIIKGENKIAGFYELNFDASNLPSGIYFYKLTAGDYNEVMKMVLLK